MSRYQACGAADGLFHNHDRGNAVIDAGDAGGSSTSTTCRRRS
jgi:hypothetical protein